MNIGIVTTWFERGAAIVSRAYMDVLIKKHSVFIYARGGEKYAIDDPKWNLPNVTWGKKVDPSHGTDIDFNDFENWVRSCQLDVILFNEQQDWSIILECQKYDVLIGAYIDYYTKTTVPFHALYDFLLCNTKRHYGVFRDHPQAFYIPWGTDCRLFRPSDSERLSTGDEIIFFHSAGMGAWNFRKGTDILIKAFTKVQGSAKLIIHSQVPLGHFSDVAQLARQDRRIHFIHETVGAPGLYHLGDVYVYPTKLEGIGLTIAEALACGLPVITTDEAPMNEFVVDGQTGTLIPVELRRPRSDSYYWPESYCSVEKLVEAIQRYVDEPVIARTQGKSARAFAIQNLDWSINAYELPDIFLNLQRKRLSSVRRKILLRKVRQRSAQSQLRQFYLSLSNGDKKAARRKFIPGMIENPRQLWNKGTWSIASDLFLGQRPTATMKTLFRTILK